jgi:hypothetical protein
MLSKPVDAIMVMDQWLYQQGFVMSHHSWVLWCLLVCAIRAAPQATLPWHCIYHSTEHRGLHLPRPFFHIRGCDCQERDHILFPSNSQCPQHSRWPICLVSEWMSSVNSSAHKQLSCEQSTLVWNIWVGFIVFLLIDLCTLGRSNPSNQK